MRLPGRERMRRWSPEAVIGAAAVVAAVLYVWLQLAPSAFFLNTIPLGGDSNAHVWGPAFMRDHLLPHFRLTGWSKDWFSGFPAFTFYFPVPALMVAVGSWILPYGLVYKWVMALGILGLPPAMYFLGRRLNLPFPAPIIMAFGAVRYLFDHWYNIYGGNLAGVFVGEYSFEIALCSGLVFLGLYWRSLHTGRGRALAALFLLITCWSHILPTIWVAVTAIVMTLINWQWERVRRITIPVIGVGSLLTGLWFVPFALGLPYTSNFGYDKIPWVQGMLFPFLRRCRPSTPEITCSSSGYEYPSPLVHHMKYVMLFALIGAVIALVRANKAALSLAISAALCAMAVVHMPHWSPFWNPRVLPFWFLLMYALAGYAIGELAVGLGAVVQSIRRSRAIRGPRSYFIPAWLPLALLGVTWVVCAVAFGLHPATRDLPWWLIPAFAWCGWIFARSRVAELSPRWPTYAAVPIMLAVTAISVGVHEVTLPQQVPFNTRSIEDPVLVSYKGWAKGNFRGYQNASDWPGYQHAMAELKEIGKTNGCGRVFLEAPGDGPTYQGSHYGFLILPHWTDGCLGTAQGIYYEGSATTFAYYLTSNSLSASPEQTFRYLPYQAQDVPRAVAQAKALGMRYIIAHNADTIAKLEALSNVRKVKNIVNLTLFEITDWALVTPIRNTPVVLKDPPSDNHGWLDVAAPWWNVPAKYDQPITTGGPADWPRVGVSYKKPDDITDPVKIKEYGLGWTVEEKQTEPLPEVEISDVVEEEDSISFSVDRTGVPVMVRTSYFPNWQVKGAKGPYRSTPNFMIVIPTEKRVKLTFGVSTADWIGRASSGAGLVGLIWLGLHRQAHIGTEDPDTQRRSRRSRRSRRRQEEPAA